MYERDHGDRSDEEQVHVGRTGYHGSIDENSLSGNSTERRFSAPTSAFMSRRDSKVIFNVVARCSTACRLTSGKLDPLLFPCNCGYSCIRLCIMFSE